MLVTTRIKKVREATHGPPCTAEFARFCKGGTRVQRNWHALKSSTKGTYANAQHLGTVLHYCRSEGNSSTAVLTVTREQQMWNSPVRRPRRELRKKESGPVRGSPPHERGGGARNYNTSIFLCQDE